MLKNKRRVNRKHRINIAGVDQNDQAFKFEQFVEALPKAWSMPSFGNIIRKGNF